MIVIRLFLLLISASLAFSQLVCLYRLNFYNGEEEGEDCEALEIKFTRLVDGDLTIEGVSGTHIDLTNDDVRSIRIMYKVVDSIPQGITKFFKNMQDIEISNSKLKSIVADDLQEHEKLKNLNLFGNLLTTLPSGLFKYTPNLESIDFSYNRLKYIDVDIFDAVPKLTEAVFIKNICTGEEPVYGYDRNGVQYVVETFILSNCPLRAI